MSDELTKLGTTDFKEWLKNFNTKEDDDALFALYLAADTKTSTGDFEVKLLDEKILISYRNLKPLIITNSKSQRCLLDMIDALYPPAGIAKHFTRYNRQ